MMDSYYLDFIILALAIILSAFFNGAETALFSIKKSELHRYSSSSDKKEMLIMRMMSKPQKILITILAGNLFVNIIISAVSTSLLLLIWGEYGHIIAIGIVTPLLIVFCEISPKIIAINSYKNFSKKIVSLLNIFHVILIPVRILLLGITEIIIKILSLKLDQGTSITEEQLDMAVRLGRAEGVINKNEEIFLKNVLRFSKKEAQNVMIPRNKALFIPYNATIDEALDVLLNTETVRAPVYKENPDDVIGMLDSRELIPYALGYKKAKKINKFIHNIFHYPASKELGELLNDFLHKKIQIAIVVDEYGGTAGVVTLSSILSELMGKNFVLWEEKHRVEKDVKIIDNATVIPGDMQIHDFNFTFKESIVSEDNETVGGYIIERLGYFPKRSETIEIGNYVLKVRHIRKNKIESVELIIKTNTDNFFQNLKDEFI